MSSGAALHRGLLLTHVLAQPQTFLLSCDPLVFFLLQVTDAHAEWSSSGVAVSCGKYAAGKSSLLRVNQQHLSQENFFATHCFS